MIEYMTLYFPHFIDFSIFPLIKHKEKLRAANCTALSLKIYNITFITSAAPIRLDLMALKQQNKITSNYP
jgi:hypothetical protein